MIRTLGVWEFLDSISYFVSAYDIHVGYYLPSVSGIGSSLTHAITYLVVSIFLMFHAPFVSGLISGRDKAKQSDGS
jgi:hypothetical protein